MQAQIKLVPPLVLVLVLVHQRQENLMANKVLDKHLQRHVRHKVAQVVNLATKAKNIRQISRVKNMLRIQHPLDQIAH